MEPRSPISTALKLAHVPSEQRVFLELDLGVGKLSEVGGNVFQSEHALLVEVAPKWWKNPPDV